MARPLSVAKRPSKYRRLLPRWPGVGQGHCKLMTVRRRALVAPAIAHGRPGVSPTNSSHTSAAEAKPNPGEPIARSFESERAADLTVRIDRFTQELQFQSLLSWIRAGGKTNSASPRVVVCFNRLLCWIRPLGTKERCRSRMRAASELAIRMPASGTYESDLANLL